MNLLFWKKNKYDIKPEDNVPQKAYGIPDYMRKEKYDVKPEDNIPREVYGIPDFMKEGTKTVFSAFSGGYSGPSYYYFIDKYNKADRYIFRFGYSKDGRMVRNDSEDPNVRTVTYFEDYYRNFINELNEEVKDWEKSYVDPDIIDGTQWNIDMIEFNKKFSGSNAFPNNYKQAMKVLQKYFNVEESAKKREGNENNYDIKPENNQPQIVYGIPDFMKDKNKQDNNKENETKNPYEGTFDDFINNFSNEDIPQNEKYDIKPEDNQPQRVYGVPFYKDDNNQDKDQLKRTEIAKKYYGYHSKNNIKGNDEALKYITELVTYICDFDYKSDDDFVLCGRKKFIYDEIINVLEGKSNETIKNPVYFTLGSLEEFISNPNFLAANEVGNKELMNKNDRYNQKNIISLEEKNYIIDITSRLLKYINDNPDQNEKYDIKPEDNQPQRVYGVPNSMFKIAKCPNCNSTNVKKYLYGMPSKDYDSSKYVLGGCIIDGNQPNFKCMDCGKDFK